MQPMWSVVVYQLWCCGAALVKWTELDDLSREQNKTVKHHLSHLVIYMIVEQLVNIIFDILFVLYYFLVTFADIEGQAVTI